jgi:uncharacterized glyoxalase superfamily protein PhnB
MIGCIQLTLVVDDYDCAIDFYTITLGDFYVVIDLALASSRFVRLKHNYAASAFELYVVHCSTSDYKLMFPNGGHGILSLALPSSDCLSKFTKLKEAGVQMEPSIRELPWGCGFGFLDPFGNRLSYNQYYE